MYKYIYSKVLPSRFGSLGNGAATENLFRQVGLCTAIWTAPPGLLDASWTPLVRSWTPLGRSWALLDASWTPLGRSWPLLDVSWTPLGRFLAALGPPKWLSGALLTYKNLAKTMKNAVLSSNFEVRAVLHSKRSWTPLGGLLGANLDALWANLAALVTNLGPTWTLSGPTWTLLRSTWTHLGPTWMLLGPT